MKDFLKHTQKNTELQRHSGRHRY